MGVNIHLILPARSLMLASMLAMILALMLANEPPALSTFPRRGPLGYRRPSLSDQEAFPTKKPFRPSLSDQEAFTTKPARLRDRARLTSLAAETSTTAGRIL
jgi:hypothetical protein